MVEKQVDILVVGGGLTGATLMLALAKSGFNTLLVEAKPSSDKIRADFDARTLALSPASVQILRMLQVWPRLENHAARIEAIHISERKRLGRAYLQGDQKKPLGYVVELQHIHQALYHLLDKQQILAPARLTELDIKSGAATISHASGLSTLKARLVVAADGTDSVVRRFCGLTTTIKHYNQHAVVANIGLARPHQGCAYERFTGSGPLALLPMKGLRASLVWSLRPAEAEQKMTMTDQDFLSALQRAFGYRLGRFIKVGRRALYPLRQVIMPEQIAWPVVFVGNAAHTLHPVAGQGFNLGLRDVALLAQNMIQAGLNSNMLQTYQQRRRHDQSAMIYFTHGLVELFTSRLPGVAMARNAGLIALDHLPPLKKLLMRYTCGFAGVIPDLVCGIPLKVKEI